VTLDYARTLVSLTDSEPWPPLPYEEWKDTLHAIHMWTQIVGKIRLATTPLLNHWWNSSLAVTPRGLTTGTMPSGAGGFEIEFDFVGHELTVVTSRGGRDASPLRPMSVAQFYRDLLDILDRLGVADPKISLMPNEVADAVPFPDDVALRPYNRDQATRFAVTLLRTDLVFERFRSDFLGKASPVQFFWGSFDLASARFSGRRAPAYTGGKPPNVHVHVMHEAYSHELIAAGFWPGSSDVPNAEYYAYAMPSNEGLASAAIEPQTAGWNAARGEFLLPYEAVRTSADPDATLLAFLESTYRAAADLGRWDRALLEERVACACDPVPAAKALRRTRLKAG
jgi:uncharacterized protein DUF5996